MCPLGFRKYEALGNDYVVIDPSDLPIAPSAETVRRICDRHHGVGADGILWGPTSRQAPFGLRMFNSDGSEFEKSGNGLRIFARFLWDCGLAPGPVFGIATSAGMVEAHILDPQASRIALDMGQLSFSSQSVPVTGCSREVIDEPIIVAGRSYSFTAVTIGNPHCVLFVEELTPALAHEIGPLLESHGLFPNRTNVQFARATSRHDLQIEIWERGAGYTLASGTSSCAAAGAAVRTGRCDSPISVHMPGGAMRVEISEDWCARLTGDVRAVCRGELSDEVWMCA
jgi:diaminopimelate epimerase